MFRRVFHGKGQIRVGLLVVLMLVAIVVVSILPAINSATLSGAIATLEGAGYEVLSASEYTAIMAKLDSIDTKADAAVANANAAVLAADNAVAKVDLFNTAERFVYPGNTSITCTLTAGNTNAWGNWTVIADSGGGNLSSVFSVSTGYITDMQVFDHSAVDKTYQIEIAYGVVKNIVGRVAYHTSFSDNMDIKSELIPVGEAVYYRMMTDGANGATARVGFRYIYE